MPAARAPGAPIPIPDAMRQTGTDTNLTRSTVSRILAGMGNLDAILASPQSFAASAPQAALRRLEELLADGIQYVDRGEEYSMEPFEDIVTHRDDRPIPVKESIYDRLAHDPDVERDLAMSPGGLENARLFVRLPGWFNAGTPVGQHGPDWAMAIEGGPAPRGEAVHMVAETESTTDPSRLRPPGRINAQCARGRSSAIGVPHGAVAGAGDLAKLTCGRQGRARRKGGNPRA